MLCQISLTMIVWFSYEAHFLLSGQVNFKNNIYWGSTPPEHCLQKPLHSVKCTAWVSISQQGIIGPFWFKDENEQPATVNIERYLQVLDKFWRALNMVRDLQWFQQDGATPHTANKSLVWLQQRFADRLISRRCDPEWSPHSPDLNPPDFYLWGYLKERVYRNNSQTIPGLMAAITAETRAITREECERVIQNFARRMQVCLLRREAHFEHIF